MLLSLGRAKPLARLHLGLIVHLERLLVQLPSGSGRKIKSYQEHQPSKQ